MGFSCQQASQCLLQKGHLDLTQDGQIVSASLGTRIKRAFNAQFRNEQIYRIANFVAEKLESSPDYLQLGEAVLKRYRKERPARGFLKMFDRALAPYRKELIFHFPENTKSLAKWRLAGQPDEIIRNFPYFAEFLENSKVLNQLKTSRDTLRIIDNQPAILVEGEWVKKSDFYTRFKIAESKYFNQTFLVEQQTNEVYTYLDNGKGLQKHHPFISLLDNPISTLSQDDYVKTLKVAQRYVREGDETLSEPNRDRIHIVQILTSKTSGPDTNFHNLTFNVKHAWYHFIEWNEEENQAKVFGPGFRMKSACYLPLLSTKGRICSPDPCEYTPAHQRIVTNIAVTKEELEKLRKFILCHHNLGLNLGQELGFRWDQQNCTALISKGQEVLGIPINTKFHLNEALWAFLPDKIKNCALAVQKALHAASSSLKRKLYCIIPSHIVTKTFAAIQRIWAEFKRVIGVVIACLLTPLRLCLGGATGDGGAAFCNNDEPPVLVKPPLKNWRNYFSFSSYWFHLPGKLQQWQLEQPSTVIFNNPVKLSIVPPELT